MDFRQLLREERLRARQAAGTESTGTCAAPQQAPSSDASDATRVSAEWASTPLNVWAKRSEIDIEQFRKGPIPGVYYVPHWISEDEEAAVLERVYSIPDDNDKVWVKLKLRRLQMWGGEVKAPFNPQPLPQWLTQISQALVDAGIFRKDKTPNHALINEYGVGDGILPHEDGPSYFPLVAIVSAGAECRITYEPHRALVASDSQATTSETAPRLSFQLERRSLLLFTGEAYTRYLHSIDNVEAGRRISLTVRHVELR